MKYGKPRRSQNKWEIFEFLFLLSILIYLILRASVKLLHFYLNVEIASTTLDLSSKKIATNGNIERAGTNIKNIPILICFRKRNRTQKKKHKMIIIIKMILLRK